MQLAHGMSGRQEIHVSAPISAVVYFTAESPAEVHTAAAQREVNNAAEMVGTLVQPS